jgi:GNAT superfamily N-acetyltransferase
MIEKFCLNDLLEIFNIINDAAIAYKGFIPNDCYHEPYMSLDELKGQIEEGVEFWCYKEGEKILGVMGIQDKKVVTLIRHAYVRTNVRSKGIGTLLLKHLLKLTSKPVLIGTWKDAQWAIQFYEKNGFSLVSEIEKDQLLDKYWSISPRQKETSVVLAGVDFHSL